MTHTRPPFDYALARPQDDLRAAITRATLVPEADAVRALLPHATLGSEARQRAQALARDLAGKVRGERRDATGADALMHAFALSSEEGVALMCLAEALLRIPDAATADALIRDKIGRGDWRAHAGLSDSMFVNATCWALVVTGKLVTRTPDASALSRALSGALARVGEPAVRAAMRTAMRFLGEQFVLGETMEEALERARLREAEGYRYSYDMLGEAALTAEDALRYHEAYAAAMHAIGRSPHRRGVADGPGLSVKLSALHPRYARAQHARVMRELMPRLEALAALAMHYDVGLAIDAEESDRLDLSLDLFEGLARNPALSSWTGLGLVVQAYLKRAPQVVDWTLALARDTRRRLMVRLVKGAYWDGEIKRAQVAGHADYPVFTRKAHTDVAYLACARKLLDRRDLVYPQFATHNAATLAAVLELAGRPRGLRVPVPARHGRVALRPRRGAGNAAPALPHLRADRHPRDAPRLPRAAAARERREHVVRQPGGRREHRPRSPDGRPRRRGRRLRRHAASARAPALRALSGSGEFARHRPRRRARARGTASRARARGDAHVRRRAEGRRARRRRGVARPRGALARGHDARRRARGRGDARGRRCRLCRRARRRSAVDALRPRPSARPSSNAPPT